MITADKNGSTRVLKVLRDDTGKTRLLLHAYAGIVDGLYELIGEVKDDAHRGTIALCGLQTLLGEGVNRDVWAEGVRMFQRLAASDPKYAPAVTEMLNKVRVLAERVVDTHRTQLPQYGLDYLVKGIPVPH